MDQLEPGSAVYNVAVKLQLRGDLDREALEKSLNWIVARHEALRTNFEVQHGAPVPVVASGRLLALQYTDLSHVAAENRDEVVQYLSNEEARRPFNLAADSLIRAMLLEFSPTDHILVLTVHHIVFDLWSLGVVYRELSEAYRAFLGGHPPVTEEPPIQFSDFVVWERQYLQGEVLESLHAYWQEALAGAADTHHLLPDHPRPLRQTYRGATEIAIIPAEIAASVVRMSQRQAATPFMTLMAALQTLLHRYSGHADISVGFPIAHRTRSEVANVVGFFVNSLVLKCNYSGNPTFATVLRQVRKAALGAFAHQDLPFEKLVNLLRPDRSAQHNPFFQTALVLRNAPVPDLHWPGLEVSSSVVENGTAKFDVTLYIEEKPGLKLILEYNRDLFDAETMKRLLGHYVALLGAAGGNPETRVSELPLLSPAERVQISEEWNATSVPVPQAPVHELFEKQAESTPEAVALVDDDQKLTYRELNFRANVLAQHLRQRGVQSGTRVGICAPRSFELVTGILGIVKAGGIYVPLDPEYPRERLAFIAQDAEVRMLLSQTSLRHVLPPDLEVLDLDTFPFLNLQCQENTSAGTMPDDVAVVLYTSGSTGRPKGVEVTHRGIRGLLFGQSVLKIDSTEVVLHRSSAAFDIAIFEIWGPLLHGGRCVLFRPSVPTPRELQEALQKHRVTTVWLTSTLFNAIIDEMPEALAPARRVLVGGEKLSVAHICRALKALPGVEIVNGYGPTEATTFSAAYRIPRHTAPDAPSIPIGRPIANERIYILDQYQQPVPIGAPGEIYIGGYGVARGYLNQPELTAQKFLPNGFTHCSEDRLYRTGDWGRWLPTGEIEFIARLDSQIKIRGFRVELGEIEAAITSYPQTKSATVVVQEQASTGKRLVAYVVLRDGAERRPEALQAFLKGRLPEYMVPADVVFLEALPMSPNGKLDRAALPAPAEAGSRPHQEYIAPRHRTEAQLAEIWEGLLGKKPISMDANFYDIGGHSLLAVRVVAAIERTFGNKLPLSSLVSNPTIEKLALALGSNQAGPSSALVAIRPEGTKPPLFCVHGGGGEVLRFVPLARQMGADQPVYGLRAPDLSGQLTGLSVESLAERYVREVRSVQPEGPFYLAGASFGGLVAYEMARRLRDLGLEVALLVLFDTCNPEMFRSLTSYQVWRYRRQRLASKLKEHSARLWHAQPAERTHLLLASLRSVKTRIDYLLWKTSCQYFSWRQRPIPARLCDNVKLFTEVTRQYQPKPYAGRVTLFKAAAQIAEFGPDPELGWGELAGGGVEVYVVPGDHISILDEGRVSHVAEKLRRCINGAATTPVRPRSKISFHAPLNPEVA